jgi:hypothetical protein
VIDTREQAGGDPGGQDPWRIYMGHDGKYAITVNNGDEPSRSSI